MPWIRKAFHRVYGSHPLHLLTMVSGFALLGYMLATFKPAALWNPGTWWQSIAVWLAAAVDRPRPAAVPALRAGRPGVVRAAPAGTV